MYQITAYDLYAMARDDDRRAHQIARDAEAARRVGDPWLGAYFDAQVRGLAERADGFRAQAARLADTCLYCGGAGALVAGVRPYHVRCALECA